MKKWSDCTKKQKNQIRTAVRAGIQLLFFLFLPGAFVAAFNGVKYVFGTIGVGQQLEMTAFAAVLLGLCVYTMVFGRFFCGFACAFGSLGDAVHALYVWICKRSRKKALRIPKKARQILQPVKYLVLAVIVILCFLGLYQKTRGMSPWDIFSMLRAGNLRAEGYTTGVILLVLILGGMAIEERFFCRFLCPLGAVFALLPVLPLFGLVRDRDQCIPGCKSCSTRCPSDIGLPSSGKYEVCGDCFQCQKCIKTCPKTNIHCKIDRVRGDEIWFTLLRAAFLFGMLIWLGI